MRRWVKFTQHISTNNILTQGFDKRASILETTVSCRCFDWKLSYFDSNFMGVCPGGPNLWSLIIDSSQWFVAVLTSSHETTGCSFADVCMRERDSGSSHFTIFKFHWGRVTHICVSKTSIIGSYNGLSPGRHEANAGRLLIGSLGTNLMKFWSKFINFHSRKSISKCRLENGDQRVPASVC